MGERFRTSVLPAQSRVHLNQGGIVMINESLDVKVNIVDRLAIPRSKSPRVSTDLRRGLLRDFMVVYQRSRTLNQVDARSQREDRFTVGVSPTEDLQSHLCLSKLA